MGNVSKKMIVVGVLVAVIVIGIVLFPRLSFLITRLSLGKPQVVNVPPSAPTQASQPPAVQNPELPKYKGFSIGAVNEDKAVTVQYPAETKQVLLKELAEISANLEKNPDTLDGWLRAGVIKKFFGDYAGARDIWEYAGLVRPKNSVSFFNLGGLYGYYLKDFSKAEKNYKKAIGNSPHDAFQYIALADFYKLVWTEKSGEILAVIENGLKEMPDSEGLLIYLAGFYKDAGNIAKAVEIYEKVLKMYPENKGASSGLEALRK